MKFSKGFRVTLLFICILGFSSFLGFVLSQRFLTISPAKWKIIQDFFTEKINTWFPAAPKAVLVEPEPLIEKILPLIVNTKITTVKGEVELRSPGSTQWIPAKEGLTLNEGDILKVDKQSSLVLVLAGDGFESSILVHENSQLMLLKLVSGENEDRLILLDLAEGKLIVTTSKINRQNTRFEIKTPTSIVDVKQGSILVTVEAKK